MKKNKNHKIILLALIFISPLFCGASQIYIDPVQKNVNKNDIFVVNVKIDTENSLINAIDGNISLDNISSLSVREISLAGSSLSIWPKEPVLSADKKTISFVGGVPGGINSKSEVLFKIIFEARDVGKTKISPENIIAYLNDGKATKSKVTTRKGEFDVVSKSDSATLDEWTGIISSDKNPPENFVIDIGQDVSMFEGKKFAVFTAVDKETGIDYYEVSEGGAEAVRSGNMYVLTDQSSEPNLNVVAYDKAGNKTQSLYPQKTKSKIINLILIILAVILIILLTFYTVRKIFFKKYSLFK